LAIGDPDSSGAALHGQEVGVGDAMAAKIRNALTLYAQLAKIENVEIRLHDSALQLAVPGNYLARASTSPWDAVILLA
jgi:hypothetical protein